MTTQIWNNTIVLLLLSPTRMTLLSLPFTFRCITLSYVNFYYMDYAHNVFLFWNFFSFYKISILQYQFAGHDCVLIKYLSKFYLFCLYGYSLLWKHLCSLRINIGWVWVQWHGYSCAMCMIWVCVVETIVLIWIKLHELNLPRHCIGGSLYDAFALFENL